MAAAKEIYVDPSALSRLYLHQEGSREMAEWRRRVPGTLPVTHHGRVEIINAISLAEFRKDLEPARAASARSWFADDFTRGHLIQVDILWRAALNLAAELSRKHTPHFGTRSLDVLHVACALRIEAPELFNFR